MDRSGQDRLILFTRYPEPGRTKTRLIPALGAQGAAALQRRMSETIAGRMTEFAAGYPVNLEIRYAGGNQEDMEAWLSDDIPCISQGEGNLGDRLRRTFDQAFAHGDRRVVILG
ncbi:MAG: DUF2064 domain-containing protein, partial [Proteobacteria bacterium]|nr:DUF2064 domain-containing protein [Pseudomonadota bacterium]